MTQQASRATLRRPSNREYGPTATALAIAALGFAVGLAGDACHVASGTTQYEWDGVPTIWKSAIWFPLLVAGAVLGAAWLAERSPLEPINRRGRKDVVAGAAAVLALYATTAALKGQPTTVSVVLTAAIAAAIYGWWDPSKRCTADGDRRRDRRSARRDRDRRDRRRQLHGRQRRPRRRRALAALPVLRRRRRRVEPVGGDRPGRRVASSSNGGAPLAGSARAHRRRHGRVDRVRGLRGGQHPRARRSALRAQAHDRGMGHGEGPGHRQARRAMRSAQRSDGSGGQRRDRPAGAPGAPAPGRTTRAHR